MNQGKKLLKETLIYSIGNFGSKILAFILVPLYTFFLTKAELGIFDLVLTSVNLFVPIVTLQSSDAVYRWLLEVNDDKNHEKKIAAISNTLTITTLCILLFSILFIVLCLFVKLSYPVYFILILISSSYLPVLLSILRGLRNTRLYSVMGIVNTGLLVLLNVLFLYVFKIGLNGLFLAFAISNILTGALLFYSGKLYRFVSLDYISTIEIKRMISYSLPLVTNIISWWLINASDRYVILYFLGENYNGIYAVSTRFPSIIIAVNSVLMMAIQDHTLTSGNSIKDLELNSRLFNSFVRVELSLVILLTLLSPFFVQHFIGKDFTDSWKYMPFLYIGVGLSAISSYIGLGYQKTKDTKGIAYTTLIGAVLNIIISVGLISKIGLYAPALGTFIGFLAIYLIRRKQTVNSFPLKVDNTTLYSLIILQILISYIIIFKTGLYFYISFIITVILLLYLNKSFLIRATKFLNRSPNDK